MSLFNPISDDWGKDKSYVDRIGSWVLFIYVLLFMFVMIFYTIDWFGRTSKFNRILFVIVVGSVALFGEDLSLLGSWLCGPETGFRYNFLMFFTGIALLIWFIWINIKAFGFFSRYLKSEFGKNKPVKKD